MIVSIVITYHPADGIGLLLNELTKQTDAVVVVDNGSKPEILAKIRNDCLHYGAQLIALGHNAGIAAAQNTGIRKARELGACHVLVCDHDSLPEADMVSKLREALEEDFTIAAVGPLPAEDRQGGDELIYVDRGWGPKRATADELQRPRLDVAFLIASGCLMRIRALESIGLMREDLFIDHVDLEWGVRARNAGWRLVAVPEARLHHRLGDEVVQLPGREQPIHVHAPIRNYYILRNTLEMIKHGRMPWKWRARYTYWAAKYAAFNALMAGSRAERSKFLVQGLADGLRGRLGPYRK